MDAKLSEHSRQRIVRIHQQEDEIEKTIRLRIREEVRPLLNQFTEEKQQIRADIERFIKNARVVVQTAREENKMCKIVVQGGQDNLVTEEYTGIVQEFATHSFQFSVIEFNDAKPFTVSYEYQLLSIEIIEPEDAR